MTEFVARHVAETTQLLQVTPTIKRQRLMMTFLLFYVMVGTNDCMLQWMKWTMTNVIRDPKFIIGNIFWLQMLNLIVK